MYVCAPQARNAFGDKRLLDSLELELHTDGVSHSVDAGDKTKSSSEQQVLLPAEPSLQTQFSKPLMHRNVVLG